METQPSELPVAELLVTVFNSIFEVFLLCLAGYILANKGILDKKTQKQLNHLNVSLFTPCLLFSKVALFLSPAKLRELWIVPIFFLLVTFTSMTVAFTLSTIFKLKPTQRNFAMAAAMFMNSNSLPIALMQSLVVTVQGLKWGTDDNTNAMLGRALTYLVLSSTVGMVLRWSFGVRLLAAADDPTPPTPPSALTISYNHQPLPTSLTDSTRASSQFIDSMPSSSTMVDYSTPSEDVPASTKPTHLRPPIPTRRQTTYYRSFPNSPTQEAPKLPSVESSRPASPLSRDEEEEEEEEGNDDEEVLPGLPHHTSIDTSIPRPSRRPHHTYRRRSPLSLHRLPRHFTRALHALLNFMTPPLWASLLSILVALIRPLQQLLEENRGLQSVKGALNQAGGVSIPVTLIVLGGYFYQEDVEKEEDGVIRLGHEDAEEEEEQGTRKGKGTLSSSKSMDSLVASVKRALGHRGKAAAVPAWYDPEQNKAREGETKTVVISILSRMVITPLFLMPLIVWGAKEDWQRVFEDPVFVVSSVLLVSSPPALTLAQITQAASGDAFERLISRTIFWSYCVVTPPATVGYVVLGLVLAKL